jgi:hypothetical protein
MNLPKVVPFIYEVINNKQVRFELIGKTKKKAKVKSTANKRGYKYYRSQNINGYYYIYARKTSPYK